LLLVYCCSSLVYALEPPTKKQLKQYKKQGTLKQRIEKAKTFGNHKIKPSLGKSAQKYLLKSKNKITSASSNMVLQGDDISPRNTGMATKGDIKIFTLLLAFSDSLPPEHQTVDVIYNHIHGDGDATRYPNESLTNFYQRSSYDQLTITGDVLEWYTAPNPREDYAESEIIKEALSYHAQQGVDFSQYDNDNDGVIDYFSIIWTGEVGEWASQWWGHQSGLYDPGFILSNKTFGTYSWQALSYNNAEDDFNPRTLIHETGHALGLPDYYDYDAEVGPPVEIPVNDMMKDTAGDHNAFSKFLLGWIEPKIVGAGSEEITLLPSSSNQDALIVMPELTLEKGLSEYFVVQNRDKKLNDSKMNDDGLLIWHVDATALQYGFIYDNSYSAHSLIKLKSADADHYYQPEHEFTSISSPSSQSYTPMNAAVEIKNIQKTATNISLSASIVNVPEITLSGIQYFEALSTENLITASVTSLDAVVKVSLFANDVLVADDATAPYQFNLSSVDIDEGQVIIRAEALTANAKGVTELISLKLPSVPSLLVVDFGNDIQLAEGLKLFKKPVVELTDVPIVSAENAPAMFIISERYADSVSLTDEQFSRIQNYIGQGGHIYYENTGWYFERTEINELWQQLGIVATHQWSQDETTITGTSDSVVAGLSYSTIASWFLLNELTAAEGVTTVKNLWDIESAGFSHAVTNTIGSAEIIATTGQFSWLPNGLTTDVLKRYLDYFELDSSLKPSVVSIDLASASNNFIEGESIATFELTRTFDDNSDSAVTISVVSDNAVIDQDYTSLESPYITFLPNELLKVITLTLKDDLLADGDKDLFVTLEGENVDVNNSQAHIFIEDNESRGEIQFSQNTLTVQENVSSYDITIERIGGSDDQIEFTVKSNNASAIAGTDYTAIDETLTFDVGDTIKTISLSIINNTVYANDKNFAIELTSEHLVNNAQTLTVTINNDDDAPVVTEKKSSGGGGAISLLAYLLMLVSWYRLQTLHNSGKVKFNR
jgi:M6 family metalloprotease-like protein